MAIADEQVAAALDAFAEASQQMTRCGHCGGKGYHHGFGEDGHDPEWCDVCKGTQYVPSHTEREAMRIALEAAMNVKEGGNG